MGKRVLAALALLVVGGCGPEVWFKPANPRKTFEPLERSASRVYHVGPECDEIGVVFADGEPGELIEPIAREAADNGGDRYILRRPNDSESYRTIIVHGQYVSSARTVRDTHRSQAAIVYRCN